MRATPSRCALQAVAILPSILASAWLANAAQAAEAPRPAAPHPAAVSATDAVAQRNPKDVAPPNPAHATPKPIEQKARSAAKPKSRAMVPRRAQKAPVPQADLGRAEVLARQRAEQIPDLLLRARRAAEEGRLVAPARENAASLYKEVLALDATQAEAVAGTQRIAGVLAKEVEFAVAAGDKARAEQYLGLIRALQPNAGAILELEARLRALDASAVVLSTRQQGRYSLSAQSIDRARSYLDNQPLNLRTIDQAIDEYDRAAALVPDSPGLPLLKDRITVLFPEATRRELAQEKSKRALKLVETARERGWTTAELEPLEAQVKATMRPGKYDTTLAECPDSVAQACAQVPR